MNQNQQKLDERFNSLPQDLKDAISSVEVGTLVAQIGDEEGLLLDQTADLVEETGYVMLGITPADKFVGVLVKKLGIDEKQARMISVKINDKVFNKIRASLQSIQEKPPEPIALSVPTPPPAPNLNMLAVEKPPASLYNDSNLKKENVLNDLENIEKLKPQNSTNFVEHLLSNPVSKPTEVEIKKPEPAPIPKKPGVDPYREQV